MIYKIFIFATFAITVSSAISCIPSICASMQCKQPQCEDNEKYMSNGSACRCCDVCAKILKKDEPCKLRLYTEPIESVCGEGLLCLLTKDLELRCLEAPQWL